MECCKIYTMHRFKQIAGPAQGYVRCACRETADWNVCLAAYRRTVIVNSTLPQGGGTLSLRNNKQSKCHSSGSSKIHLVGSKTWSIPTRIVIHTLERSSPYHLKTKQMAQSVFKAFVPQAEVSVFDFRLRQNKSLKQVVAVPLPNSRQ